jgi:hypothetical protein
MTNQQITVTLDRDLVEHLFERCTESTNTPKVNGYSCEDCRAIGTLLGPALDAEDSTCDPERPCEPNDHLCRNHGKRDSICTEYRVVTDTSEGGWASPGLLDRDGALRLLHRRISSHPTLISHLQVRTITATPWIDVEEGER